MRYFYNHWIKRIWHRRRNKKYIRILIKKEKSEVTVETAIVFTVIMILICSMIYLGLFLHDKVAINSYAYSGLVEGADKDESECSKSVQSKVVKTPTFVIKPTARVSSDFNKYTCSIEEREQSSMVFLNNIFTNAMGNQTVDVVRKMPTDKMHLFKTIKDGITK